MGALTRMRLRVCIAAFVAVIEISWLPQCHGWERLLGVAVTAVWLVILACEAAEYVKRTERRS